jgi:hypothetical protein
MTVILRSGLVLGLVGLVGCGTPKIMLHDSFLPDTNKVVRESLKQAGSVGSGSNETQLTNYYVQICDVNGSEQSNCKTTLVIENITNYNVQPRL